MAVSAVGSYYDAQSRRSRMAFQARMADLNSQLEEKSAQAALRQGEMQAGALSLKAGQIKSSQRARLAANGVDLGVGSAAEQLATTDVMKEIDMNTIQSNALATAWGHRIQATNFDNEALMARAGADSISPGMSAATSLLGSAGHVASYWYTYSKARKTIPTST
jgi:hypothetical protein